MRCAVMVAAVLSILGMAAPLMAEPIDVDSRRELFVDDYLIESLNGARLVLHHPTPREVAIVHDAPWEGNACMYTTVLRDGDLYRMYYHSEQVTYRQGSVETGHPWLTCYAESRDGVHWTKPELGLFEFEGSKKNNIILTQDMTPAVTHNFTPFLDTRPGIPSSERFKALGGGPLVALVSADGIHWKKMRDEPVITKGAFDSQNLAFWDSLRGEYRAY